MGDYTPTERDIQIITQRINEKLGYLEVKSLIN